MTVDLSPEAVERLARNLELYFIQVPVKDTAAATLRALSARLAEVEAALATARADGLRETAALRVRAPRSAPRGHEYYTYHQGYKAAIKEKNRAILALIPQEQPNE